MQIEAGPYAHRLRLYLRASTAEVATVTSQDDLEAGAVRWTAHEVATLSSQERQSASLPALIILTKACIRLNAPG
jgi:hypothetical protein